MITTLVREGGGVGTGLGRIFVAQEPPATRNPRSSVAVLAIRRPPLGLRRHVVASGTMKPGGQGISRIQRARII